MKRRSKTIEVDVDSAIADAELSEKLRLKFKAEWEKRDMDRHFATDNRDEFSQEAFLKDAMAIFGKL